MIILSSPIAKTAFTSFSNLLHSIEIQVQSFNLNRCDERTLYIPIALQTSNEKILCDLIYLIDKQDLFGAVSLNHHYDHVRDFFMKHFNYELLYTDEQSIAKIVSDSPQFSIYLNQYAATYPKYVQPKFFSR